MILPNSIGYWWIRFTEHVWINCPKQPQEIKDTVSYDLFQVNSLEQIEHNNKPALKLGFCGSDGDRIMFVEDVLESIKVVSPWKKSKK